MKLPITGDQFGGLLLFLIGLIFLGVAVYINHWAPSLVTVFVWGMIILLENAVRGWVTFK